MAVKKEEMECGICEMTISEKGDYEVIETYLAGNFEDMVYVHTNCRYDQEQKMPEKIKLRMEFLEKQGMKRSPEYSNLESILNDSVKPSLTEVKQQ